MPKTEQESKQTLSKVFLDRLAKANGRLKAANVGVSVERIGKSLYLVATLPPRPGSHKTRAHQQRIATGWRINAASIELAEKEARKVGALVDCEEFSWEPYLKGTALEPKTVSDWVTRFTAEFQETVAPITWKKDYHNAFVKLPADEPLTVELMKEVLRDVKQHSRTRRRCALAFGKLANYAGLEANFKPMQGNYSASEVEPRDLPDDRQIAEYYYQIKNPGWRWVYGMIAAFGLRGHEPFYLDIEALLDGGHMVHVKEGKTGRRMVWACYPEWVDRFNLRSRILPDVTGKQHADFTERVCKFFGREIPFHALDLRHRWAVRTLEFGLPCELAAKQMGHSVAVHERTYHRWISADTHQRAYDVLMMRDDRPKAPTL
jgi:integrase